HRGAAGGVAFSRDGKRLFTTGADQTVKVWDPTHGAEPDRTHPSAGGGHHPAFSPDGRLVAWVTVKEEVQVADLAAGGEPRTLPHGLNRVQSLAFSPDGRRLAVGGSTFDPQTRESRGAVTLWDPAAGQKLRWLGVPGVRVVGVAFSGDGRFLAAGSRD